MNGMLWGFSFIFLLCLWGLSGIGLVGLLLCSFLFKLGVSHLSGEFGFFSLGEVGGYECGFESVYISGGGFSLQFYVVGLSFLVFDLEISLFLPIVGSGLVGVGQVWGVFFLCLVFLVYLYELKCGALSW
uniref:NADH-ubiquinone oxidoreductase chain 3 n=1 Tax=Halocynthia papillosa TaxID=201963 RepID=A0A1L7PQ71_HALPP|nr:NADH dehydrogenase subunit 3 [Halocynthia papillosa]